MTLERYFKTSPSMDHEVRHEIREDGTIKFYIFPKGNPNQTVEYTVKGNWVKVDVTE